MRPGECGRSVSKVCARVAARLISFAIPDCGLRRDEVELGGILGHEQRRLALHHRDVERPEHRGLRHMRNAGHSRQRFVGAVKDPLNVPVTLSLGWCRCQPADNLSCHETDIVYRTGTAWPVAPAPGANGSDPEQARVVVAYDVKAGTYRSIYGMGRFNHENAVPVPGYEGVAILSGDDTFSAPSSQTYLYTARDARACTVSGPLHRCSARGRHRRSGGP